MVLTIPKSRKKMGQLLTASKGGNTLLSEGNYVADITAVEMVQTDVDKHPWTDSCPQLKVSLEIDGQKIDLYQSLRGYKYEGDDFSEEIEKPSVARLKAMGIKADQWKAKSTDEKIKMLFSFEEADEYGTADKKYAVYRVGEKCRVESTKRTEDCLQIAGRLGFNAGIAEDGDEFDTDNLVGASIGIEIEHFKNRNGKTYMKVRRTMTEEAVNA